LGYTCLNIELQQRFGIRTNRSCRRKTFEAQGLAAVSRLALANCRDLLPLIQWNRQKGIHFFRIPSALFPWSHEYELEQLPDYEEIAAALAAAGAAARAAHQRLTAHPSHFVQLAAQEPALLARSIAHLELNSKVFDLMGYAPSHENKINIHIGTRRGSKAQSLARFAAGVERLSDACRARLTVENDDRPGMYSIADLLPLYNMARTPLVFDYLHHALAPGKLSEEEALLAALATWPPGVRPVVHYRWGRWVGLGGVQ
jgi:UV DNA damage endonuclease